MLNPNQYRSVLNPNHYSQGLTLNNLCDQLNICIQNGSLETKWEGSVTILSVAAKLTKKVFPPNKILPSDADHVTQNVLASRNNEA